MDLDTFQHLPTEDVAQIVRRTGSKVCVFPINGTRRWIMLEYPQQAAADFMGTYFEKGGQRYIEVYKLLFAHGIGTVLTPIFGPSLLERGEEYAKLMVPALLWIAQNQSFLDFYDTYDVRVRVYGDAPRYFPGTPYEKTLEAFDELARRTASHSRYRLFFGVCAHDATETVAEIGARFYQEHDHLPSKRQIIEAYYGEYIEPVDFFIGFDRPAAFDMPLIATGNEDLYFAISPSLYLDVSTLRAVLYDHLFTRQVDEASYANLSPQDWTWMKEFYYRNRGNVLGVGVKHQGIWYPQPQVSLPTNTTR